MLKKPNLTKPVIGGSVDEWGLYLNRNIDAQDLYNQQIADDQSAQDQELSRLEMDKVSKTDVDELVTYIVDNYVDAVAKPELDAHVETVNKVELDRYIEQVEKPKLDSHVETVNKVELDNYVETTSKVDIDNFTEEQKVELDEYEKIKEQELNTFNENEKIELGQRGDREIERIRAVGVDGILDEIDFTTGDEFNFDRDDNSEDPYGDFRRGKTYRLGQLVDIIYDTKQEKTDEGLGTVDKTIVGAVNELLLTKENNIVRSNSTTSQSEIDVATSKSVADLNSIKADKTTNITTGAGLVGGGDLSSDRTLSVVSADEGIIVNEDNIRLNIVDDLITGGVKRPLSAEQGRVLKQLIDTIGTGGTVKLMQSAEVLSEYDYMGTLPASGTSIAVGRQLFNPTLYLDGVRMESNRFSVELNTGLITLNEVYADYPVVWVVEDQMPHHIDFCFPTMGLLVASEDMKSRIELGNVIKILGDSDADDGGHYLVKCEDVAKLNAVDIGEGRYLNEIPNTKIATLKAGIEQNKSDILLKLDSSKFQFGNMYSGISQITATVNPTVEHLIERMANDSILVASTENIHTNINPISSGGTLIIHKCQPYRVVVEWISDRAGTTIPRKFIGTYHQQSNPKFNGFKEVGVFNYSSSYATPNGWIQLSNGQLLQWGRLDSGRLINFHVAFANTNYVINITSSEINPTYPCSMVSRTNTYVDYDNAVGLASKYTIFWFAIGY